MIPDSLSAVWTAIAPAMANHLWQSTLFAAAAAVLALALRKNPARVRYRLWLVASVKFLMPFSLFVSLGGHLARPHVSESAQSGLYFVVEELSQPFTGGLPLPSLYRFHARRALPICCPGYMEFSQPCGRAALSPCSVYGGGAGGDLSASMRSAAPASQGREVDALRRLEQTAGVRMPTLFLAFAGFTGARHFRHRSASTGMAGGNL